VQSLREPISPWDKVAFLAGCWRQQSGESMQEEIWTPAHGNSMYGQNRLIKDGKLRFFELLRIDRRGDDLVYIAMPAARSVTSFELTASTKTSVTFTNPEHDFPNTLIYERTKSDELVIQVIGTIRDKEVNQTMTLARVGDESLRSGK